MDRRTLRTRKAIFRAFTDLLNEKKYSQITVQDIIDRAEIGRSTFYDHFETKDALLTAVCDDIFDHVFTHDRPEKQHDFSQVRYTPQTMLTHMFQHILEQRAVIRGLLASEGNALFASYFRQYISQHFQPVLLAPLRAAHPGVPDSYLEHHLCGSFLEAANWWFLTGMRASPEEMTRYYLLTLFGQEDPLQS